MTKFKFYDAGRDGGILLELHDNHTLWQINKAFWSMDYESKVEDAIWNMEHHFKNLEIFIRGRSGRHICVEDTPINRRRYNHLVTYAEKLEQELIDYFNNHYVMEE